jgi:hypothetical protein
MVALQGSLSGKLGCTVAEAVCGRSKQRDVNMGMRERLGKNIIRGQLYI